jgi:hypothetical protein
LRVGTMTDIEGRIRSGADIASTGAVTASRYGLAVVVTALTWITTFAACDRRGPASSS